MPKDDKKSRMEKRLQKLKDNNQKLRDKILLYKEMQKNKSRVIMA